VLSKINPNEVEMSLNLDVVIDADPDSVDMKAALETMQGASDAVRTISETLVSGKVPKKRSHKSSVSRVMQNQVNALTWRLS
jgi:hypothetical protein